MYVCYRKHRPRTIVRLDAHVTDRLVIGGVLAAVLSDTVIAAMQPALMELEEQGGGADALRAEDLGLVREDPYLFLRAVGGRENARDLLATFVARIPALPGPGGRPLPHAVALPQPPRRGDGTGDSILPESPLPDREPSYSLEKLASNPPQSSWALNRL